MPRGTGAATYSATSLSGTPVLAKTGKCSLAGFHFLNASSTTAAYVQFFDKATAGEVTLATTVPSFVIGMPASGGATRSYVSRIEFTNGMVLASTTTATGSSSATIAAVVEIGD
jgi:hypothetical protein